MAVGRPKTSAFNAEEHAQVSALAASRSLPHAIVAGAKLVLWAAQGESNFAIAQRLGWTGRRWASGAGALSSTVSPACTMNCGPDVRAPTATSR